MFARTLVIILMAALVAISCAKEEDGLAVLSKGGGSGGTSPNRLPPGKYDQTALSIPASINDQYYSAPAPWAGLTYLWSYIDANVFGQYAALTLPTNEVIVAVIDTGVDKDHEDLAGRLWKNPIEGQDGLYNNKVDDDGDGFVDDFIGYDFVNNTNNPGDDHGHGTHVSGTIAAIGSNGIGIVGIAPWVRIMPLKVCSEQGECDSADIRSAIVYAYEHGAKVINLSLGALDTGADSIAFDNVIKDAHDAGAVVVVAGGNSAIDAAEVSPANARYAIAVAAHRSDGGICSFSNYGWKVEVSGPGCALRDGFEVSGILSLNSKKCGSNADAYCSRNAIGTKYTLKSGTSMAAPHVSGMAAVAWTASPTASPLQIRQALLRASRPVTGANSRSIDFGAGKISGVNTPLNLVDEARTAPGLKITSPRYGAQAASHDIGLRIEARAQNVTWTLRYQPDTLASTLNLAAGTAIGNGGTVFANTSVDLVQPWNVPAAGDYLVVLDVEAAGQHYYDVISLRN